MTKTIDALEKILAVERTAINDSDAWTEIKLIARAALREALAKPDVQASFTDEDMKASWLTGFKEAEFQFRGGTEKSGEFPAKTPLSVPPQAAPPKQPSVPPGYALVPVEPTPDMRDAALKQFELSRIWSVMLAAAPQPKGTP